MSNVSLCCIIGFIPLENITMCWGGLVVSVWASHAKGRGFLPQLGHTKEHHKIVQTASLHCTHALGLELDTAAHRRIHGLQTYV